jgi:hypothetical protein
MTELGLIVIGAVLGWSSGRPARNAAKLGLCLLAAGTLTAGAALASYDEGALASLPVIAGACCRGLLDLALNGHVKKGAQT